MPLGANYDENRVPARETVMARCKKAVEACMRRGGMVFGRVEAGLDDFQPPGVEGGMRPWCRGEDRVGRWTWQ